MEDALAKARAIAARLSAGSAGSDLGKRKNRFDEDQAGLGSIKKKKVYIPVKDHPEINFLGLLIGPRGITQKQLQEVSGAKIIIRGRGSQKDGAAATGHPDDDDELHVCIEGSDEAIEKALKDVEQILYNPEQAMRLKQEQLRNLAELNGTTLSADSTYGPGSAVGGEGDYQIELRVPNGMVGLVIGKGGENIHRMQVQTGAHMQIAKESDMKPGDTLRSIILKGTPDAVAELKKKVEEVITSRSTAPSASTITARPGLGAQRELEHAFVIKIAVPNDKVGIIIGKGGMTIKSIQERTRAHVQIPTGADEDNPAIRTLSIGADTKESAEAAQMDIMMALQQQATQQAAQQAINSGANAVYIAVPDDKIGLIIGKGGMTIKDIQSRTHCRIQIPQAADPGTMPPVRTCSITGTPEAQHAARYEIEMVLQGQAHTMGGGAVAGGQYRVMPVPQATGAYDPTTAAYAAYYAQAAAGYQYAAQGAMPGMPVAGAYDWTAYQAQIQAQQAAYAAQYQQTQTGLAVADTTAAAGDASGGAPQDPTAYYNDFWQYAAYYGEAKAREYYQAWSPPVGTPPPAGYVIPQDPAASTAGELVQAVATNGATSDASSLEVQATEADTASLCTSVENSTNDQGSVVSTDPNATSAAGTVDKEAARLAYEQYKKEYAEWYEAYGKAAGANPDPPVPADF